MIDNHLKKKLYHVRKKFQNNLHRTSKIEKSYIQKNHHKELRVNNKLIILLLRRGEVFRLS